jgi:hypothetical protein
MSENWKGNRSQDGEDRKSELLHDNLSRALYSKRGDARHC